MPLLVSKLRITIFFSTVRENADFGGKVSNVAEFQNILTEIEGFTKLISVWTKLWILLSVFVFWRFFQNWLFLRLCLCFQIFNNCCPFCSSFFLGNFLKKHAKVFNKSFSIKVRTRNKILGNLTFKRMICLFSKFSIL